MRFIIAITLIGLTACAKADPNERAIQRQEDSSIQSSVMVNRGVSFTKDPETGCEYVVIYSDGITPRVDSDGVHVRGCNNGN